jgi:hypothetical protein
MLRLLMLMNGLVGAVWLFVGLLAASLPPFPGDSLVAVVITISLCVYSITILDYVFSEICCKYSITSNS